jgi:hypothetical protein
MQKILEKEKFQNELEKNEILKNFYSNELRFFEK